MEKLSRVLSDFAVEPEKMTRVRGGFLLETGDGLRMLQEYRGGTAKLAAVEALQKSLREQRFFRTDLLLRTKKGELSSRDVDGTVYVLKEWFAGQECGRENRGDLFAGMELLAEVHALTERTAFAAGSQDRTEKALETAPKVNACGERHTEAVAENAEAVRVERCSEDEKAAASVPAEQKGVADREKEKKKEQDADARRPEIRSGDLNVIFEKRIRELRRARNFLKSRRRKTDYESELLRHADYYISCGEKAQERLSNSGYEKLRKAAVENGTVVHGAYHYHNILILTCDAAASVGAREEAESRAAATLAAGGLTGGRKYRTVAAAVNFERMQVDLQITDVYDYIRKILEKNGWNGELGYRLLDRYRRERPISEDEMEILRILFRFPEKYWKLVNHYCNHSKSWLPGKNPEKLAALVRQEEARVRFVAGL